jgi:hypothetical protein
MSKVVFAAMGAALGPYLGMCGYWSLATLIGMGGCSAREALWFGSPIGGRDRLLRDAGAARLQSGPDVGFGGCAMKGQPAGRIPGQGDGEGIDQGGAGRRSSTVDQPDPLAKLAAALVALSPADRERLAAMLPQEAAGRAGGLRTP